MMNDLLSEYRAINARNRIEERKRHERESRQERMLTWFVFVGCMAVFAIAIVEIIYQAMR